MIEQGQGYTDVYNQIHNTFEDALTANLYSIIDKELEITKPDKVFYAAHRLSKELKEQRHKLAETILVYTCANEAKAIIYWIMNNSQLLDTLTTYSIDMRIARDKNESLKFAKKENKDG